MNKKLLFGLFAAVGLLFASCTSEEPTATEATTRVILQLPRATTTYGDGTKADHLVWEVYNKAGERIDKLCDERTQAFDANLQAKVDLQLAKGQTYLVLFWAQKTGCNAYNYSNLKNIQVNYPLAANNEDLDAFFGSATITIDKTLQPQTVELHRPFAQLNFAVTAEEVAAAALADAVIKESKIVVKELATGFNVETGAVTGKKADVAFDLADIPTEDIELNLDGTGAKAYKRLSMNYILANDESTNGDKSVLTDVTFTFPTKTNSGIVGDDIVIESLATPIQRNYRTNVIGSLTNTAEFTIVIVPAFENDDKIHSL